MAKLRAATVVRGKSVVAELVSVDKLSMEQTSLETQGDNANLRISLSAEDPKLRFFVECCLCFKDDTSEILKVVVGNLEEGQLLLKDLKATITVKSGTGEVLHEREVSVSMDVPAPQPAPAPAQEPASAPATAGGSTATFSFGTPLELPAKRQAPGIPLSTFGAPANGSVPVFGGIPLSALGCDPQTAPAPSQKSKTVRQRSPGNW